MAISPPPPLRRYWLPLLLFATGLFFQLFVLPSSFPPTHYDVLGIERYAPAETVSEAYERLYKQWLSDTDRQSTAEIIEIRYAYELLTNPIWKRDYDLFGLDEHLGVIQRVKEQYQGENFLKIDPPLLEEPLINSTDYAFNLLTHETFKSATDQEYPLLIQVYSKGSRRCAQFIDNWKKIDSLLDGVANTAMVELGDVQLAAHFAERKFTKQPFFRNGLPALVAYAANCRDAGCYMRYQGELSVDAIADWAATTVVGLPRILYYSKETLVPKFIGKSAHHKVKVICFSSTGERAAPFLRKAAQQYLSYASFALVLWREEDSQIWWNTLGVESAPAFVFLKGPGVKPVVYHGTSSNSEFMKIMEEHKHQELRQLRSDTSLELGCDARGYSRAGSDTKVWYCVIVAGRPSVELSKMRETMRRAQDKLMADVDFSLSGNVDISEGESAAAALKERRLTFVWLDGEVQKKICAFYLASDYDQTCGPRAFGDSNDVPQLFIVRFQRNSTDDASKVEKKENNIWDTIQGHGTNYASQLVARYNGSEDIQEIIQWISQIIKDGDTREIPYFTSKTPDLVPEESNKQWLKSTQGISSAGKGLKERVQNIGFHYKDYLGDPRVGPSLLLCACISFGAIWLKNSQTTQPTRQDEASTSKTRRRGPRASTSDGDKPESITDVEPKDAQQWLSSGSDSD